MIWGSMQIADRRAQRGYNETHLCATYEPNKVEFLKLTLFLKQSETFNFFSLCVILF